ncbi:MAG TPA: IclR family transcriptional regulator [Candidatus Limnocylindrales bacterium]|nr:IclR family transcriptional regulator [Candidatus Limnocylindrales bacterium]
MSTVQSIQRAFAVLSALADGPIGVTEVADRVGLPKSTAARMLASLTREGAVEQVPGDTRYRLGGRIVSLAAGVLPPRSLVAIARPILVELASAAGEAAGLAVPDGASVHYIDQVDTAHQVQVRDWTGTRAPMHAVSSGQVFLAHLGEPALERYLALPRVAFTARTLTDSAALRDRLRRVQLDGFAWVREEFAEGLNSVAAPVAGADGEIVAAVHLHGPSYRFPERGREAEIAAFVVGAAARLSARLRREAGASDAG